MIQDKDVNLYLKKRQEIEVSDHHNLLPTQLREERLKQLKLDNLVGPELKKVFDTQIQSFDNYQMNLRVYIPHKNKENKKTPIILFFHEGGFVVGNLDTHDYQCRCISKYSQMIVLAIDYRLAPENKFPISYKDAENALKSLEFLKTENCDLNNIIVCGESAGGNLATVLSINSLKNLLPKIKGQILFYPWVDFTLLMRSSDFNLPGATLRRDTVSYFAKHYLIDRKDEVNFKTSPLFSKDLYNQPDTFIFAAELDPLLDEGIAYYNRLKSYGNNVIYKLYKDQLHGFMTNSKHFLKGLDCLREISENVKILASDY